MTELVPLDTPRAQRPPNPRCTTHQNLVRFVSARTARDAGMAYHRVEQHKIAETIRCNAEVRYDAGRHARLSPAAAGVVEQVLVEAGARVKAGQVLARVRSAELGAAKAAYSRLARNVEIAREKLKSAAAHYQRVNRLEVRLAGVELLEARALLAIRQRNYEREQGLSARNATSEKELLDAQARFLAARSRVETLERKLSLFGLSDPAISALDAKSVRTIEGRGSASELPVLEQTSALRRAETDLQAARRRLQALGLPEVAIRAVATEGDTDPHLALRAPFDGIVVERHAVTGEHARPGRPLLAVADTRTMWAVLDLYERDMRKVGVGQPVLLIVPDLGAEAFTGKLVWTGARVDPRTRTLSARAMIANPEGLLRAGMFADAVIQAGDDRPRLVLPKTAVQWEGCCNVVFVRRDERTFEPRKVRLGYETSTFYEVREGLKEGETVVTTGSFLLKTEILKGSIGAGCCGD